MICVSYGDKIQQSGDNDVLGAIVRGGVGHHCMSQIKDSACDVQSACTQIAHKTQNVKNVSAIRLINTPLHQQTEYEHGHDRAHEEETSNPALLNQMPGTGNKPRDGRNDRRHSAGRRGNRLPGCSRFLFSGRDCHSDNYEVRLYFTSYLRCVLAHQHVDFTAHSEFRQIDARFNRKATVGQNAAFVVNFKVVHIGAVGVDIGGDGVAGAMDEVVAVTSFVDVITNRAVHLPPGNCFASSN